MAESIKNGLIENRQPLAPNDKKDVMETTELVLQSRSETLKRLVLPAVGALFERCVELDDTFPDTKVYQAHTVPDYATPLTICLFEAHRHP